MPKRSGLLNRDDKIQAFNENREDVEQRLGMAGLDNEIKSKKAAELGALQTRFNNEFKNVDPASLDDKQLDVAVTGIIGIGDSITGMAKKADRSDSGKK